MQVSEVFKGAPDKLVLDLNALAAGSEIQFIQKTRSAGYYIVIYDDAGGTGQTVDNIVGDPVGLSDALNALISGGSTINAIEETFSAANYLVVYT